MPRNHRAGANTVSDALLLQVAQAFKPAVDTVCCIACEAGMMRRIRDALIANGVPCTRIHGGGYWKAGATAYPDHDYGDDA